MKIWHQYMSFVYVITHAMHACSQMKSRFQRWGNKTAMLACIEPLHRWVRQGNVDTRLECVRNLTLDPFVLDVAPTNESLTAPELVAECHTHLVEFFLAFAAGQVNEGETNTRTGEPLTRRQKPYGNSVCTESYDFKSVSACWLSITGASVYPFLVVEKTDWENIKEKGIAYPVTQFWPTYILKRFIHFNQTFWQNLPTVFSSYEDAGGKYYNESDDDEGDGDITDDSAGCDDVF